MKEFSIRKNDEIKVFKLKGAGVYLCQKVEMIYSYD